MIKSYMWFMSFLCFVSNYETLKVSPRWVLYLLFFTDLLAHIVKCWTIKSTSNPDMIIWKTVYLYQGYAI